MLKLIVIQGACGAGFEGVDDRAFLFEFDDEKAVSVAADEAALKAEVNIEIVTFEKGSSADRFRVSWQKEQVDRSESSLLLLVRKGTDPHLEVVLAKGGEESGAVSLQDDLENLASGVSGSSLTNREALVRFFADLPAQLSYARSRAESAQDVESEVLFWEGSEKQGLLAKLKRYGLVLGGVAVLLLVLVPSFLIYRRRQPYYFPDYKHSVRFGGKSSGGGSVLIE